LFRIHSANVADGKWTKHRSSFSPLLLFARPRERDDISGVFNTERDEFIASEFQCHWSLSLALRSSCLLRNLQSTEFERKNNCGQTELETVSQIVFFSLHFELLRFIFLLIYENPEAFAIENSSSRKNTLCE